MARGITYDEVKKAADHLVAQGLDRFDVTSNKVRPITGTGSLSTIDKHLGEWREAVRPKMPSAADEPHLKTALLNAVTDMITAAIEAERKEAHTKIHAVEHDKARIEAERDDAIVLNEQIDGENQDLKAERKKLQQTIREKDERIANLEGGLGELRAVVDRAKPPTVIHSDGGDFTIGPDVDVEKPPER